MYRIDSANKAATLQVPAPAGGGGYFQDTGNPGTVLSADWANMIQEEIANVVTGAGLVLSKTTFNQLQLAIQTMIAGGASTPVYAAIDVGSANTMDVNVGTFAGAYAFGQFLFVKVKAANTGATTLQVNSLGSKAVKYQGAALAGGELLANESYLFFYDGAVWELLSPPANLVSPSAPAGAINLWLDGAVPSGWAYLRGQAISRSANPTLFGLYGTKYGAGDGSTTFNLPNPQGYATRIFDSTGAIDPGRTIGDFQGDTVKAHRHLHGVGVTTGSPAPFVYGTSATDVPGASGSTAHTDSNTVQEQGYTSLADATYASPSLGTQAAETRGKNMSFNLIIKLG